MVYCGIRGISLAQALRDIASGSPPAISRQPGSPLSSTELSSSAGGPSSGSQLVNAAMARRTEKYSQPRRWQSGYSDCSSFVGKAFKDIGITPPIGSTTLSYLGWGKLRKVQASEVEAGDLVYCPGHIVIAIDKTTAIGQQNSKKNVRIGLITQLTSAPRTYLRYKGW